MELALAITQAGVSGPSWVTNTVGPLAVGKVIGSRETPVTLLSCYSRQAFTLASQRVTGYRIGSNGRALASLAYWEGIGALAAGVTPDALNPRAAQAPAAIVTDFWENAFQVAVTPFYIASYWVLWAQSINRRDWNSQAKWEIIVPFCTRSTGVSGEIRLAVTAA